MTTELQLSNRAFQEPSSAIDEGCFSAALSVLFSRLQESKSPGPGNTVFWSEFQDSPEKSSGQGFTSPYLYTGTSGIALFLSAYYQFSGCPEARDLAIRAMAPIHAKMAAWGSAAGHANRRAIPIGGLNGLGAFVYTFLRLAQWLDAPEFLSSANLAAAAIAPENIRAYERLDVMSGCAGALLALLALLREPSLSQAERQHACDLAVVCGEQLLVRRVAGGAGPRAWPGAAHPPVTGFAHGASGIGYALIQLFEYTGEKKFLDAALEGFVFERNLYDPGQKTWLDPRFERPLEQTAWCNGAPGVALSRLGALRTFPLPLLFKDLELALSITAELPESPRDHLCCGNFGWVEIMSTAGRHLNRPNLVKQACRLAMVRLKEAEGSGFCFPFSNQHPDERRECRSQPSLFLGLAGVGYTLLRLLQPERFPCLLLLD